jgi:hypothetical protein
MKDYIIILLVIAVYIVQIIRKNKRTVVLQPQKEEPTVPADFFEMLESMEIQPVISQPAENIKNIRAEMPAENPFYEFTANEEGGSILKDIKSNLNAEKTGKTMIGKRFPLRKAVIYNEILNRKYI